MKFSPINREFGSGAYQAMGASHVYTVRRHSFGWRLNIAAKRTLCKAAEAETIGGTVYPARDALYVNGEHVADAIEETKREAVAIATAFESYEGWDGSTYGRMREARDDARRAEFARP